MASGRGRADERGGDDGDGSDEDDLEWRCVRRKRESSDEEEDDDGEDCDERSVSSAGAEFGDDSDGQGGGASPEDEALPYYFDDLDVGDGEDGEEGASWIGGREEVGELAAMVAEKQMSSQGEEDKEQWEREHKEIEAVAVPRRGAFYMHDDRTSHRARRWKNYGARRLIEPHEEGKWQHDKFEQVQGSNDAKGSSRVVRGRGPIKYPLAIGYNRYLPKETEEVEKYQETRSNSGRVLAEASSQQVGSPALKKEVSASHQNRAAPKGHPTMSSFNHAISALTKMDAVNRNTEGNSPKSVLSKNDPSMETSSEAPLVRDLGDSTRRDQHPSKEWKNNLETVQWQQGQGTDLPYTPQHAYQHPASNPNRGAQMINNHVVRQTFLSNSFLPCFQGYAPQYSLFGPSSGTLVPSASEIGTVLLPAGLNNELIHPVADRQTASLPLQPIMTWANSPPSLQWNGHGVHLSPSSSQYAYHCPASIPQTPLSSPIQPQLQGYGQQLYPPSGPSDGLDNPEIGMAGRVSGADGTFGRTCPGFDTHTNQNFTTVNIFPVNQVRSHHHGGFGEIGPAYYAAEPSFGNSTSGLAWPLVWTANAGPLGSVPPSTYVSPTTSAYCRAYSTESESSLSITSNEDTGRSNGNLCCNDDAGRLHEGSNPVEGSEMPNTTRGQEGYKLQRYSKMNFGPCKQIKAV